MGSVGACGARFTDDAGFRICLGLRVYDRFVRGSRRTSFVYMSSTSRAFAFGHVASSLMLWYLRRSFGGDPSRRP